MCKVGDIILVETFLQGGRCLPRHYFVVLSTEGGTIQGLNFDIVCNMLSSFKNEEQRKKKLSYPGNFELVSSSIDKENKKDGFVKAEQLYFFNREKTDYRVVGNLLEEIFKKLIEYIENLDIPLEHITDNL